MSSTRHFSALLAGFVLLFLTACASTQATPEGPEGTSGMERATHASDGEHYAVDRLQNLIQGRVAGVRIADHGHGFSIQIRGNNSINRSGPPLYIVDGVRLSPSPNGLIGVDPQDVASIRIIRSISEATMYGAGGNSGVVIIETKRGR